MKEIDSETLVPEGDRSFRHERSRIRPPCAGKGIARSYMKEIEPTTLFQGRDPMAEERMDPASADSASFWEHAYRYRFAAKYVRGKRVLDIACGEGYGTAALQRASSKHTVGIDLSRSTCARARKRYGEMFLAGDAHAIPFADGSIDVIVSFETIEHIGRPEAFLDECVRILAPKGLLILSTPNKEVHGESTEQNPFHCSEMSEPEFLSLLSSRFRHTEQYTQMIRTAPWWSPRSLTATHARWVRRKGGWRAREWMRTLFCPHIVRELREADRLSPVEATLTKDRFLSSWVNPYCVHPRSRSEREQPWYLIAVSYD